MLTHNTSTVEGTVPVILESPNGFPFTPGERETDWHETTPEEYAAYVAYWDGVA